MGDTADMLVAADAIAEGRTEFAAQIPAWRKQALALYNAINGTTFAHPYEYVTRAKPQHRTARTLGDIFCRFCGERLFYQVKQPHRLIRGDVEAQRHLTICALLVLGEMRKPAPLGHRVPGTKEMFP